MGSLSQSQMKGIVAVVAGLTVFTVYSTLRPQSPPPPGIVIKDPPAVTNSVSPRPGSPVPPAKAEISPDSVPAPAEPAKEIVVHVTGAVKSPGVYHLKSDSRGEDALKAAGGPTADANTDVLNLAAHLEDGSQLRVPTKKEAAQSAPPPPETFVKHDPTTAPRTEIKPALRTVTPSTRIASRTGGRSGSNKLRTPGQGTVNINTADAQELQRLNGVGPAMAERILDYRKENGPFKTPDDLLLVSGIGPKKYAKMQDFIRVK